MPIASHSAAVVPRCFLRLLIRRERIHALRKVHEPPGFDESKNDDFCVGNAFMHSASVTVLSRYVEWKKVKKQGPVTIQRTTDVHRPFGTDESVPYAEHNVFTIQYSLVICGQGGIQVGSGSWRRGKFYPPEAFKLRGGLDCQTISTLMVLVLPVLPLMGPPVSTTLSPGCRFSTFLALARAW